MKNAIKFELYFLAYDFFQSSIKFFVRDIIFRFLSVFLYRKESEAQLRLCVSNTPWLFVR